MLTLINDQEVINPNKPAREKKSPSEVKKESTLKTLNLLSKQVIGKLNSDKVPPTPENYKIYFDVQLETKSDAQRREISEILELEAEIEDDHTVTLEKDIQNAFIYIKSMTESIANAYNKINQMKKITIEKEREMEVNPSRLTLVSYEEDLEAIETILEKELQLIKSRYNSTAELIRNFNQNSIYDKKYGVYNKKYLMRTLDAILKSIENFEHDNTLLSIKIKPESLSSVRHQKDKSLINITLAKLLLKRSRRSDVVGHYGDNIFMIILKHTDEKHAQIAIDRIKDMIDSANFIVDSNNVDIKLNFGISAIESSKTKEEILVQAIDSL
jgi:diguanylate cyclase (GGDEF)-like protein